MSEVLTAAARLIARFDEAEGAPRRDLAGASLALLEDLAPLLEDFEPLRPFRPLVEGELKRLEDLLEHERQAAAPELDTPALVERLVVLWLDDQSGVFRSLGPILERLAEAPVHERLIHSIVSRHLESLPLVMTSNRRAPFDPYREALELERHACERLLGVLLARRGQHEFGLEVARRHAARAGDVLDLVRALHTAGDDDAAVFEARRALADPRTFRHAELQATLDQLLARLDFLPTRANRRDLEGAFLSEPSRVRWHCLRTAVHRDQWPGTRRRLLSHLTKHRRELALVFALWVEEGEVLEADRVAVGERLAPEVLVSGSEAVAGAAPMIAAGWLVLAAHRRAADPSSREHPLIVRDLLRVRELATAHNQLAAFERALLQFHQRHAGRPDLSASLRDAGL